MSPQRPHSHRRRTRRPRRVGIAAGLLAMAALLAPAAAQAGAARTFSAAELTIASDAVLAADVAGTAWHVDTEENTLLVAVDSTVSSAEIARIEERAGALAEALTIERTPGVLSTYLAGGEAAYAQAGWRCSAGFTVRSATHHYVLTAGHCVEGAGDWYTDAARTQLLGSSGDSSFPGDDYGLVRYDPSVSRAGTVSLYDGTAQDIATAADPVVGQAVQRGGSTTGMRTGTVTGLNATVNYGGGDIVSGLIRTDVCAEPGDSGGPLFSGDTAFGITSGGSGNCSVGGTTYFQPVLEVLNAYGLDMY